MMKAAFLTGIRQIQIKEIKKPVPQKGEVLIKLKSIGVCGSDIHYYRTGKRTGKHVRRANHANRDLERVVSLMEKGALNVKPLVTHRFPLNKIKDAFDMVDGYKDGVIKAMIEMK